MNQAGGRDSRISRGPGVGRELTFLVKSQNRPCPESQYRWPYWTINQRRYSKVAADIVGRNGINGFVVSQCLETPWRGSLKLVSRLCCGISC